jgi:hypothetical protein
MPKGYEFKYRRPNGWTIQALDCSSPLTLELLVLLMWVVLRFFKAIRDCAELRQIAQHEH